MLAVTSDLLGTTNTIYNWLCSFLETLSLARPFIYCPAEVVCSNEACVESVPVLGPHSSGAALETSGFARQRCLCADGLTAPLQNSPPELEEGLSHGCQRLWRPSRGATGCARKGFEVREDPTRFRFGESQASNASSRRKAGFTPVSAGPAVPYWHLWAVGPIPYSSTNTLSGSGASLFCLLAASPSW